MRRDCFDQSHIRLYPKSAIWAEFERHPKISQSFMVMLAHRVMDIRTRDAIDWLRKDDVELLGEKAFALAYADDLSGADCRLRHDRSPMAIVVRSVGPQSLGSLAAMSPPGP
jgi:hypothetical protein